MDTYVAMDTRCCYGYSRLIWILTARLLLGVPEHVDALIVGVGQERRPVDVVTIAETLVLGDDDASILHALQ